MSKQQKAKTPEEKYTPQELRELALFGENLRKIREEQNIAVLGIQYGTTVDSSAIYKMELGTRNITLFTILQLADALHVPAYRLLNYFRDTPGAVPGIAPSDTPPSDTPPSEPSDSSSPHTPSSDPSASSSSDTEPSKPSAPSPSDTEPSKPSAPSDISPSDISSSGISPSGTSPSNISSSDISPADISRSNTSPSNTSSPDTSSPDISPSNISREAPKSPLG